MSNTSKRAIRQTARGSQEARPSAKPNALDRARKALAERTGEEDAAITAAARSDPDSQPNREFKRRLGRPKSAVTKRPVLLRLDPEVVERFKADGEGWQTRMNEALRKAAGID